MSGKRTELLEGVVAMDSVSFASRELDAGGVIVTGSHGGTSAGEYAARAGVRCVVCNDAGFGKNDAGVAGLRALDAAGIAVAHDSARIGDGLDTWRSGVISYVNEPARRLGFTVGERLADALERRAC